MLQNIKKRESNFELLRIISMFGIILFHYSDHGCNDITYDNALPVNAAFEYCCRIGGGFGNCVFMILTGYFVSKSELKIKKIIKLWSQVFFYSVISYVIACSFEVTYFEKRNFIDALLPITSNQYWYFTSYIVILFMALAINSLFENLNKKHILIFMVSLLYFFSIMPTLGYYSVISDNRVGVMLLLYCIGAYIRKYHSEKSKISFRIELLVAVIMLFFISCFSVFYDKYHILQLITGDRFGLIWGIEKTPIIIFSTIVFLFFKNANISFSKNINWIASSVFGVYLLHMNNWTTQVIWNNICRAKDYYLKSNMIGHVFIYCILIYVVCTVIDKIRNYLIEQPIEKAVNNFTEKRSKVVLGIFSIVLVFFGVFISRLQLISPLKSSLSYNDSIAVVMIDKDTELEEKFFNNSDSDLKKISFHTITWNKVFDDEQILTVSIRDDVNQELIYSQNIGMNDFIDQGDYEIIINDSIRLKSNHWYNIEFSSNTKSENETMALMMTNVSNNENNAYINGQLSNSHIAVVVSVKKTIF